MWYFRESYCKHATTNLKWFSVRKCEWEQKNWKWKLSWEVFATRAQKNVTLIYPWTEGLRFKYDMVDRNYSHVNTNMISRNPWIKCALLAEKSQCKSHFTIFNIKFVHSKAAVTGVLHGRGCRHATFFKKR